MKIGNLVGYDGNFSSVQNVSNQFKDFDKTLSNKMLGDTFISKQAGFGVEKTWQDIANKYDVTNMSQKEVGKMNEELSKSNLIPKEASLFLLAPQSINQKLDEKYDVLDEMKNALEFAKRYHTSTQLIERREQVVEVLEKLNELSISTSS